MYLQKHTSKASTRGKDLSRLGTMQSAARILHDTGIAVGAFWKGSKYAAIRFGSVIH